MDKEINTGCCGCELTVKCTTPKKEERDGGGTEIGFPSIIHVLW